MTSQSEDEPRESGGHGVVVDEGPRPGAILGSNYEAPRSVEPLSPSRFGPSRRLGPQPVDLAPRPTMRVTSTYYFRPLVDFMMQKENVEAGKISSMIFLSTAPNEKVVEGLYRHFVKSTNRLAGLEIDLSGALVIGKSIRPVKCLRDWTQGDLNRYRLWIENLCYAEDQDAEGDRTSMSQVGVSLSELCRQYFALASGASSSDGVGQKRNEAAALDYLILKLGLFRAWILINIDDRVCTPTRSECLVRSYREDLDELHTSEDTGNPEFWEMCRRSPVPITRYR
mmetsp:Transcript_27806/g.43403  ORF Transcript_27806/g.43403 Transcript_27806/m.43403 type:complete len:283 (-) Transcript_27806:467-1315(-)